MRSIRVFLEQNLSGRTELDLPEGPAHHLLRVLRLRAGAELVLFDGCGLEYPARIEQAGGRSICRVSVDAPVRPATESRLRITLIQAIGRGDRMDWCVQKATELGVARIRPVFTERTEVRLEPERSEKRVRHWRQVAISAAEQSGRVEVPVIDLPQPLDALDGAAGTCCYLDPDATAGLGQLPAPEDSRYSVVIGPEGGLSPAETARLAKLGFVGARLGPRILRTETAGPAVLAVLQARFGDFA